MIFIIEGKSDLKNWRLTNIWENQMIILKIFRRLKFNTANIQKRTIIYLHHRWKPKSLFKILEELIEQFWD